MIVEKFVKGGIFSAISTDTMYFYKHILRKPMPNKKHGFIANMADKEYLKDSKKAYIISL